MRCPECRSEIKDSKLNTHCKKIHGIYYAFSNETYVMIVNPLTKEKSEDGFFKCPECSVIKLSIKELGNHYALSHAKDMECHFKKRISKKNASSHFYFVF